MVCGMRFLVGVLVIAVLAGIYIWALQANRRTPVPEGCEQDRAVCGTCSLAQCPVKAIGDMAAETKKKKS